MDCANLCRSRIPIENAIARLYRQPERPAGRVEPLPDRTHTAHRYPLQVNQPRGGKGAYFTEVRGHSRNEGRRANESPRTCQARRFCSPAWPDKPQLGRRLKRITAAIGRQKRVVFVRTLTKEEDGDKSHLPIIRIYMFSVLFNALEPVPSRPS